MQRSPTKPADDTLAGARAALKAALADAACVDLASILPRPRYTAWTLAPDALRFVVSLVRHLRPRHILEFGCGLSTQALARVCNELPSPCYITSVDHDPEFGRACARELADQGAGRRVTLQLAPLVARRCRGRVAPIYLLRRSRFASRRAPDLILIDGPPEALGGRAGALYQAVEFARPGTLVLLDDAERKAEKKALSRCGDKLGEAVEVSLLAGFARGLAAIIVRQPKSGRIQPAAVSSRGWLS